MLSYRSMLLLPLVVPGAAGAQAASRAVMVETYTSSPKPVPWTASMVSQLRVPQGFKVEVFASGVGGPRIIAVNRDNTVFVTRRDSGDIVTFKADANGKAGPMRKVAKDMPNIHGIAIDHDMLYMATIHEVHVAPINPDGTLGAHKVLITDLPEGGQHPNRTLAVGPDRMLYISIGSTCNQCIETNPENATIVRSRLDGSERGIYARGLRNTIGWAWQPDTKEMWGLDHGYDLHGNGTPPEEFNRIASGSNYGWPFCYSSRKVDSVFSNNPRGTTKEEFCPKTVKPALELDAHVAPIQMLFYTGSQFPPDYRGSVIATLHGSWNREPPAGYKVVRIRFEGGKPVATDDLLSGFLVDAGQHVIGRPAGLAQLSDGSILVGDDANGAIYRISYIGGSR